MSGALAVALREIRERRLVFVAGPLLAVNCHLASYFATGLRIQEVAEAAVAVVLICFALVVGTGLGASVVGRDIGERRLGFYFARPLSGAAIWGGKMLAAFALTAGATALTLVPFRLFAFQFRTVNWEPVLALFTILVLFMSAAAVVSGAIRSRSGLLIADIVGLPIVAAAFFWVGKAMIDAGGARILYALPLPPRLLSFWAVIVVLLAASAAQVVVGRVEPRRGHLALSAVTFGGLLACAFGLALYGRWVTSATPQELRSAFVAAPASGDWVVVTGGTRRTEPPELFVPGFLLNTTTGESRRMAGGMAFAGAGLLWSPDGRRVLWSVERPRSIELRSIRVDAPEAEVTDVATEATSHVQFLPGDKRFIVIELDRMLRQPLALSSDGRLLVGRQGTLRLVDIEAQREVAQIAGQAQAAMFLPGGGVRLLAREQRGTVSDWRVFDWDGRSDRVDTRATFSIEGPSHVRLSPDAGRLLVTEPGRLSLYILDDGRVVTLDAGSARNRAAGLLSDGGAFSVEESGPGLRLRTFGPDGATRANVTMPGKFPVRLGGEPHPGLLALGIDRWDTASLRETVFVDVATGEVRRRETDLTPAARWGVWFAGPTPGSAGTRLFWDSQRALVRLDPLTRERRVLIATGGPAE